LKAESLNTLITAKNLLDKAHGMCTIDDSHITSAGLVILQDAVELVFWASLIELGVDEKKSLDNFSFDQLIGELRSNEIKVPKSRTIKALNKQRVIVKHYGQLAEPEVVRNYLSAANVCINEVLKQVFKKQIEEIWLHEFITNEETKSCFRKALDYLTEGKFFRALFEIRKALFIEVESDYSIVGWKDFSSQDQGSESIYDYFTRGGHKAPYSTRNKEWIEANVKEPYDYIQLDPQELRSDLLEWGVNTQDFSNLLRLTPQV